MRRSHTGGSPQRLTSKGPNSVTSFLKLNMTTSNGIRKTLPKYKSSILHKRQDTRVTDNGEDVTPKLLMHKEYPIIEDKQLTAFDTSRSSFTGSSTLLNVASSQITGYRLSTSNAPSSSFHTGILGTGDELYHMDSLFSTQKPEDSECEERRAPSQFYLQSYDSNIFHMRPGEITITLKETETFFIFEMPQLTADKRTPEGDAVLAENERYKLIIKSNRKLTDAETQTHQIYTKSRGTYLGRKVRYNKGTYVSNWEMYDTIHSLSDLEEVNGMFHLRHRSSRTSDKGPNYQFQELDTQPEILNSDEQLQRIYLNPSFKEAARVMLRILANSVYITAQKRFTGLIKQDPYAMDLDFTYSLDLLWTFNYSTVQGYPVTCFSWNYENSRILAVGYDTSKNSQLKDGAVIIFCAKNPGYPERVYYFDSPVSCLDWSKKRPNILALGLYNGSLKVIDVRSRETLIVRESQRKSSPSYEPHWQVQWWNKDDYSFVDEVIYTSNQDGRIFTYQIGNDFICNEIMKVPRIEGEIEGIQKTLECRLQDIPVSKNPGALVLRKHPNLNNIYFVGTDEGCIHRCSTNYLHQHIESFLAHNGPVYSMEFSPYCSKIFLTAGADWCARIWAEGITEPLITLSIKMAGIRKAVWSPKNSTVIATIVDNEISIWDIKRKTYRPTSVTVSSKESTFVLLEFTRNGSQLVAADSKGTVYIYNLEGMPFPPFDQARILMSSIEKNLVTKPSLLETLKKAMS